MSELPKLKLKKPFGYPFEEIRDLEQTKIFLYGSCGGQALVVVEGQAISSYEELFQLAQNCYKDKVFLRVTLTPLVLGGG